MTTKAIHSKGTLLQRGDGGGSETFTTVAEVLSFTGPSFSAKFVDVTSMDSVRREYIAGLSDAGEITMECNLVSSNAQQQGLIADQLAGTTRNFKLIFNDNTVENDKTTISFAGIVTQFAIKGTQDAALTVSVSVKITGSPTIVWSDQT